MPRSICMRALCAVWLTLLCSACHYPELSQPQSATEQPDSFSMTYFDALAADGWQLYRPVHTESLVIVSVYRDGALASLGHNHILSTGQLGGLLARAGNTFDGLLFLSPWDFRIDDPALRQSAGTGFESEPDENDRRGTRGNLLSDAVLDVEQHPFVTARIHCGSASQNCTIDFSIAGAQLIIEHESTIQSSVNRLIAHGEFAITHEDLGLEPFSVGGGAIRVAEEIRIAYRLVFDTN